MTGPELDATDAPSPLTHDHGVTKDGKRPSVKAARAMQVPVAIEYRLIRHLANSRVPFTNGCVESLIGDLPAEDGANVMGLEERVRARVGQAVEDAWAWGWIDRVDEQWKGRL